MTYNAINDDNVEEQDMMIISINSHYDLAKDVGKEEIYSHFKRNHSNVLIMHFGDYSENYMSHYKPTKVTGIFNEYKAKKLYEFIKRNKDKKMAVLHCGAGISRSGAVGIFIHDLYGTMIWDEFKRKNPQINPNQHVLRLLKEQLNADDGKTL